jgi:hypothetical protein
MVELASGSLVVFGAWKWRGGSRSGREGKEGKGDVKHVTEVCGTHTHTPFLVVFVD